MVEKDIPGYEGFYKIRDTGEITSLPRYTKNNYFILGGIRKLSLAKTGYLTVRLSRNGVVKTFRHHRLMAEAFLPNPENKPFVNHKDGNKTNNSLDNLEWVTELQNSQHAVRSGLFDIKGINNPSCDKTIVDITDWMLLYTNGVPILQIADEWACDRNSIRRLLQSYYGNLPTYRGKHPYNNVKEG